MGASAVGRSCNRSRKAPKDAGTSKKDAKMVFWGQIWPQNGLLVGDLGNQLNVLPPLGFCGSGYGRVAVQ